MSERIEIVVMSNGTDKDGTVQFLDPISGTVLRSIKCGGEIAANCLSFVGNDFLMYTIRGKTCIHSSKVNGELPGVENKKYVKGSVTALAVSPNSRYCVFGFESNIQVWCLDSGEITHSSSKHFHGIKFIKFTDDGSCFVTAGLDGLIIVWNLAYILSCEARKIFKIVKSTPMDPMYVFTSHSLPVTDLHVGHGGMQAFVTSVSGDQTCKIHSLADGNLIVSLVFKCALSAVTMSVNESELFVGTIKGNIHKCSLSRMPRTRDYHMDEVDLAFLYQGHDEAISCLSTSLDGLHLLSGSSDGRIILWDIKSGQSVKVLKYSHPVVNVFFAICPKNVFQQSFEPSISFCWGQKEFEGITSFYRKSGLQFSSDEGKRLLSHRYSVFDSLASQDVNSDKEYSRLKMINKQLFEFAANDVFTKEEEAD